MKKHIKAISVWLLVFALVLSLLPTSVYAAPKFDSGRVAATTKAELFGEFDLESGLQVTVIVELEEVSIIEAKHTGKGQTKEKIKHARESVIQTIAKQLPSMKVNREYDYLFSGFSVELPSSGITTLLNTPGIKAIYPDVHYQTTQVGTAEILEFDAYSPQMLQSAPFIGSQEAWDAGFTGKGIKVAILDTGVDYTHPDLQHAFGSYKGWDFVDNDADPQEHATSNHGTHVAGTVAANGLIKGVAPEAQLLAYRVLGPNGGSTANVVAAIERAVMDGAHVMNLSLGNTLNSPDWATSIALDWAMAEGVVAVTSNGNSGPKNWTVGSPGTSREAISVGATQLPERKYAATITTVSEAVFSSAKMMGYDVSSNVEALSDKTYDLVYAGLGAAAEFEKLDVEGKVVLIHRGEIAFVTKVENAYNAGAVAVVMANNAPGEIPFYIPGMALPTIKLNGIDGMALYNELIVDDISETEEDELEESEAYQITLKFDYLNTDPELVADFSSRGPVVSTWMIKPDVLAPGVNIISTVPGQAYASMQGTSMASPHVAGAVAVILHANPHWTPHQVKSALMNTADRLIDPLTDSYYPHNTQGAGSIRVLEAIEADFLLTPGNYSFGVFDNTEGKVTRTKEFVIENLSTSRKVYSFNVEFTGAGREIKVTTSKNLRVQAGQKQAVSMNVQVDTAKLAPGYYEGTIRISDGSSLVELPTILFIQEPDYPRLTMGGVELYEGEYIVWGYAPTGLELLEMYVFDAATDDYVGFAFAVENITDSYFEIVWDTTVDGELLAPGVYYVALYGENRGDYSIVWSENFEIFESEDSDEVDEEIVEDVIEDDYEDIITKPGQRNGKDKVEAPVEDVNPEKGKKEKAPIPKIK